MAQFKKSPVGRRGFLKAAAAAGAAALRGYLASIPEPPPVKDIPWMIYCVFATCLVYCVDAVRRNRACHLAFNAARGTSRPRR